MVFLNNERNVKKNTHKKSIAVMTVKFETKVFHKVMLLKGVD